MDYHSNRFSDSSFLVYDDLNLIGIIPGEIHKKKWTSHGGLTFGGLITGTRSIIKLRKIIQLLLAQIENENAEEIELTLPPTSYMSIPDDSLIYELNKAKFDIKRIDLLQGIYSTELQTKKLASRKSAACKGMKLLEVDDCTNIIENVRINLETKYDKLPTHTAEELNRLKNSFPEQISFKEVLLNGEFLAGDVVFHYGKVDHLQYLTSSSLGKKSRAQDFLVVSEVEESSTNRKLFSFGKSTSGEDAELNIQLQKYKNEYGGFNFSQFTFGKKL